MAWFKFGQQDSTVAPDAPVETVETMRSRAKRRLIGALVLVVTAVVGFPLLFDTQPRPVLVDVPIEIPDKNKVKPLTPPVPAPTSASTPAAAAKVDDKASLGGKEEIVSPAPVLSGKNDQKQATALINTAPGATKSVVMSAPIATDKAVADKAAADKAAADKAVAAKASADKAAAEKAEKAAAEKVAAEKVAAEKVAVQAAAEKSKAEAAKAQALLEGKAPAAPTAAATSPAAPQGERFIVQFGSFADVAKLQEVRRKVEKAGLKTYAQVADTAQGKLVRVRVGPFATRAEAEKAAAKIKSLDLPAAILTL